MDLYHDITEEEDDDDDDEDDVDDDDDESRYILPMPQSTHAPRTQLKI